MKKILLILLAVIMTFIVVSCGDGNKNTRTITDSIGDEVQIPEKVDTVINLVTYGTQVMVGLGLGDYLVGVSPDAVESAWITEMYPRLSEITEYDYEVSAEVLLQANADIVLIEDPERARFLREKGVTAVCFGYLSMDEMKSTITMLGEILGGEAETKCESWISYLELNQELVATAMQGKEKESVYYINGVTNKGLYKTSGKGSTVAALCEAAYLNYPTSDLIEFPTNRVDSEAILAKNPDNVVISGAYQHVLKNQLLNDPTWQSNTAVKNGDVYTIPMGISSWDRYSIEVAILIPWMTSIAYPEYFEYDIIQETIDFYKEFSGYQLTEEQAGYIINGLTPTGEQEFAN